MSRALDIAFLSHLASPRSPTGAERSLALLAEGLVERGHRVVVVVPGPWALAEPMDRAGVEIHVQPVRSCWMTYYRPIPFPVAVLKWLRYARPDPGRRALASFLESRRPDVVHVNCLPHVRGASAASGSGLPVIWHVREILPAGPRRRWFARRLARDAHRIVAVSEATAEWIREDGPGERLAVVHNGVEPPAAPSTPERARQALGLPVDGCVVGLYGQIVPHKGVIEFLRAARLALGREPGLRFVLAGDGPAAFLERVRREIDSAPGAERFHLIPPQPAGDTLMAAADVACLTTLTPDPLPRSVLEAMAAGVPVAAFRSGGTVEMVEDRRTGLLVEVGDVGALSDAVVLLARDGELRARLGRAAARRATEAFSLGGHVDRMEALLLEVARP